MRIITGIPASPGIAVGSAFLHVDVTPEIPRYSLDAAQVEAELGRLEKAREEAKEELRGVFERAVKEMNADHAAIFEAHLLMLEDPDFTGKLEGLISGGRKNAEWALLETAREFMAMMRASPDPVFRERAVDIHDVSKRVLYSLLAVKRFSLSGLDRDVVLVVHDLLPSDVLTMNRKRVKAIVMDMGSGTSHTAILARAFNIPAVLGLSSASAEIAAGDLLAVDGTAGEVIVAPDRAVLSRYQKETAKYKRLLGRSLALRDLPAETLDGRRFTLKANIEFPEEAEKAADFGAEGIGLYRSEFLFFTPGKAADEEMQFGAYSRVLKAMGTLPVTIRTVDIGGDKVLSDFEGPAEKNPLLGWRAIRFSLSLPDLFRTQLRAILRSGVNGNVSVMFPLISGIEELDQARAFLDEVRADCVKKGCPAAEHIQAGAMVEVPSAALIADILAERSDFFSIGTNDLIQYSLAVDRGNERVSYLAQPVHPAVLRLIKRIIDAAHEKGISAAMCGEMAGNTAYTAVLAGLGLDEFSMAAPSIPGVKSVIRKIRAEDCRVLAEDLLAGRSASENAAYLETWMKRLR